MTSVLLIYPFFKARHDRSVFRFPPLGICYIAASLKKAGHTVSLIDCTFQERKTALGNALAVNAEVVGIYCMETMLEDCLMMAHELRGQSRLLVAGGPLPTCDPLPFLNVFDVVVIGEGEQVILEVVETYQKGSDFSEVKGIVFLAEDKYQGGVRATQIQERVVINDLDTVSFPARELLPNDDYIQYTKRKYGYSITTIMSTRGCPYRCEFCSNVIFGGSYRERSPGNVLDEVEEALRLGYEQISFSDDVFTMRKERVAAICDEIIRRGLKFQWECLGRVDSVDAVTILKMKQAGCKRIYFGIESANETVLRLMNKKISPEEARTAVFIAHAAGLQVGAFFILFYPGDTDESVLQTLHFAASLPLDYIGLSMPYPIQGTALYERIKDKINQEWQPSGNPFLTHRRIYNGDFSQTKMWFGIIKGTLQFKILKNLGFLGSVILAPFEWMTDRIFLLIK